MLPQQEILRRLDQIIARVDGRLRLDRGAVRHVSEPYPGVEYGLQLGDAGALLFVADDDMTADDWETRLARRLDAARRYLEQFPAAQAKGVRTIR